MKSSVAGIVDINGGIRVVVTEIHRFKQHLQKGERLFIMPHLLVDEPLDWDQQTVIIPRVIEYAQSEIKKISK